MEADLQNRLRPMQSIRVTCFFSAKIREIRV